MEKSGSLVRDMKIAGILKNSNFYKQPGAKTNIPKAQLHIIRIYISTSPKNLIAPFFHHFPQGKPPFPKHKTQTIFFFSAPTVRILDPETK